MDETVREFDCDVLSVGEGVVDGESDKERVHVAVFPDSDTVPVTGAVSVAEAE